MSDAVVREQARDALGTGEEAPARRSRVLLAHLQEHSALYALSTVMALIVVYTSFASDVFMTFGNLRNILLQSSVLAILAAGTSLLMISGGIDLSIAAAMSLCTILAAALMQAEAPLALAIAAGVCLGGVIGAGNGVLAAWSPTHPFIVTLGVSILIQGISVAVTGGLPIATLDPTFVGWGSKTLFSLPIPVWIAGVALLASALLLRFTVFGRRIYALGGNERAARLAGVRIKRMKIVLYALNGLFVGVAAILLLLRVSSADPFVGSGFELAAIAAVAVGGVPLSGGKGGIVGTLLGVLLLGIIANSFDLLGISSAYQFILQGAVIVVAVMTQRSGRSDR